MVFMKTATSMLPLLVFAAATHFLVDLTAGMLNPLWPRLDDHYRLLSGQGAGLFLLWGMTTSVSQFIFGLLGDRFASPWLIWVGPLAAVVCLGSIGLTQSPVVLAVLLTVAGLGIAAYHPEAAALAGSCAPEHRSRAMSIFTMGGFMGQAIGPIYSGNLVDALGLSGMSWTILTGLIAAILVAPLGRGTLLMHRVNVQRPTLALRELLGSQMASLGLVLVIGSLRIIAASGVPILIGYLLEQRGASAGETGQVQSAFMLGIGLGGLACAALVRHRHERLILWLCPLVVAPLLLAIPSLGGWLLAAAVCISGLLLGVSLPVLISYGQQLLPGSQRVASSITMGVSWGLGGAFVSLILLVCQSAGRFGPAFIVFAVATTLSSVLCYWLPAIGATTSQPLASAGELENAA
jgi:FSR family fosmidomycin resistance protein-like MFS transporter